MQDLFLPAQGQTAVVGLSKLVQRAALTLSRQPVAQPDVDLPVFLFPALYMQGSDGLTELVRAGILRAREYLVATEPAFLPKSEKLLELSLIEITGSRGSRSIVIGVTNAEGDSTVTTITPDQNT